MPKAETGVLDQGLAELGVEVSERGRQQLSTLSHELSRWGARINLTGHRDPETITRRLVLDALALLASIPTFQLLADLGSGAGFPGLPMAIVEPNREFILVESRERRHFFQRQMIRQLGLANVRALQGRFDVLEPTACDAVVTQAVADPAALVGTMLRWSASGGMLLVPGGELDRSPDPDPRFTAARSLTYQVPLGGPRRTLWVAQAARSAE